MPEDRLEAHVGFLVTLIATDNQASTLATRRILGWEPTHPGPIADLDAGDYFTTRPVISRSLGHRRQPVTEAIRP